MPGAPRKPFRFGVVLFSATSRADWVGKCRAAESLGYDVLSVPDHLGLAAPLPALVLAAEATRRPRVGTYVLNTSFHHPAGLARDAQAVQRLIDDRLELGLGTGYVEAEFAAAGLRLGSPAERFGRLAGTVAEVSALPSPPRLLLGGDGRRVLRLAAKTADVVSFLGTRPGPAGRRVLVDAAELATRAAFVRRTAGARDPELNVLVKHVVLTGDRRAAAGSLRRFGPDLTPDQLLAVPTLCVGTAAEIAEQLRRVRAEAGFSYVTVPESSMRSFGRVIERLG